MIKLTKKRILVFIMFILLNIIYYKCGVSEHWVYSTFSFWLGIVFGVNIDGKEVN